jgi:hypothetical protein
MSNIPLAPTLVPKVFRFTDIDAFRSSVRNLNVDFTPLVRTISAEQIILNLPGCDVNYTKSFPRIIDAQLAPNCTAVGFTMDDGYPIRFNRPLKRAMATVCSVSSAPHFQPSSPAKAGDPVRRGSAKSCGPDTPTLVSSRRKRR